VLVTLRSDTKVASSVKNTIVESEITRWDLFNALFLLNLPVAFLQFSGTSNEVSLSDLARPERFNELLELTLSADVGETEVSSRNHILLDRKFLFLGRKKIIKKTA
jgi:hypothetical protein